MLFDAPFEAAFGGVHDPDDVVYQVIRLLRNAATDEWDTATPAIRTYWDDAQSERGPGAGQPPVCYVWSPTDSTLEPFSMDGTRFDKGNTVEVQVWALRPDTAKRVQQNVTHILGTYINDNSGATPYSTLEPSGQGDFREQKPARDTQHYVMSVEIETRGLPPTREKDSGAFTAGFDDGFA
ncbi:SPP1 gp17-like tail completion protein [Halorubrum tailed virus 29]|uniref:SPP1 gp17-like tail completion protein n=1 Tax=Halorubrum tailed virus 29 TaxID=2878010 RepID=A0AAE9BZJ8_9CAUD|nr:SPP1 gp17-like tail completion protein [Halorubrum tailed virus 29]UBF23336.1 SPP1 gp17-like tail completion protein [Halorubrum tailed virus 29]